jgi:hypothetical protein
VGPADRVSSIDIFAAAEFRGWVGEIAKPSWRP